MTMLLDINVTAQGAAPGLYTGWLVATALLAAAALIMMYFPRTPSCLAAYMALWCARLSGYAPFADSVMWFWGVAVVIVMINHRLLPGRIRNSRRGVGYMATGAITGMALGLTLHTAASIIVGAAAGAIIAAVAYARTADGAVLQFPTSRFFNYLGAKGIPAVITAVMTGFILTAFIMYAQLQP